MRFVLNKINGYASKRAILQKEFKGIYKDGETEEVETRQ